MTWMPEDRAIDSAVGRFRQRCCTLGIPSWRCDRAGDIVDSPELDCSAFSSLIESAPLRACVHEAAMRCVNDRSMHCEELTPGLHLVTLPVQRKDSVVLLHLDFDSIEFASLAAWAQLDVEDETAFVEALRVHFHETPLPIESLQRILEWMNADAMELDEGELTVTDLSSQLADAYEQISAVYRIGRSMNCLSEPEMFIQSACNQHQYLLGFKWVAVQYVDSAYSIDELREVLVVGGEIPCDNDVFSKVATDIISGWQADQWTKILNPDLNELAKLVGSEIIIEPITHDRVVIGAILAGNKQGDDPDVTSAEVQLLDAAADFIGVFHQNVSRYEVQRSMFLGTVHAMSAAIDAKDRYTQGHSERVAMLSRMIATSMGLSESDLEDIYLCGLLHDIGKIGVPEAVLGKPGKLTDEEFDMIKRHPQIGYDILKDIPPMQQLLPGVLYHHERFDGKGYPEGLSGEAIPIFGRIIAVADAFDAMSSDRSYRSRLSRDQVLEILRDGKGTQWDAPMVDAFLRLDLTAYDEMIESHVAQEPTIRDAA